jgi:hypothetical protein
LGVDYGGGGGSFHILRAVIFGAVAIAEWPSAVLSARCTLLY